MKKVFWLLVCGMFCLGLSLARGQTTSNKDVKIDKTELNLAAVADNVNLSSVSMDAIRAQNQAEIHSLFKEVEQPELSANQTHLATDYYTTLAIPQTAFNSHYRRGGYGGQQTGTLSNPIVISVVQPWSGQFETKLPTIH